MTDAKELSVKIDSVARADAGTQTGTSWRVESPEYHSHLERKGSLGKRMKDSLRRALFSIPARAGYELVPVSDVAEKVVSEELRFMGEDHHHDYGRPWCLGRDQLEHLLARGLQPEHSLLDVGCGALRSGIWLIPYLDTANYYGVDYHLPSLEAGAQYEIPFHRLGDRQPHLLHSERFELDFWKKKFDWILSFAMIQHLYPADQELAMQSMARVLNTGGRLVITGKLPFSEEEMSSRFGLVKIYEGTMRSAMLPDEVACVEYSPLSDEV